MIAYLKPCRILDDKVVPLPDASTTLFTTEDLALKFGGVSGGRRPNLTPLAGIQPGNYVGLYRQGFKLQYFVMKNENPLDNQFRRLFRRHSGLIESIQEIYLVEDVQRDAPKEFPSAT